MAGVALADKFSSSAWIVLMAHKQTQTLTDDDVYKIDGGSDRNFTPRA